VGVELKTATTMEAALEAVRESPPALVIVDLNQGEKALAAVEQLRRASEAVPIVGFLSHVEVELAERARTAGCTEVMPRSKFTQNLAAILARARL